jgi:hypothetical protein
LWTGVFNHKDALGNPQLGNKHHFYILDGKIIWFAGLTFAEATYPALISSKRLSFSISHSVDKERDRYSVNNAREQVPSAGQCDSCRFPVPDAVLVSVAQVIVLVARRELGTCGGPGGHPGA